MGDMEEIVKILLILFGGVLALAGGVIAVIALNSVSTLRREIAALRAELATLRTRAPAPLVPPTAPPTPVQPATHIPPIPHIAPSAPASAPATWPPRRPTAAPTAPAMITSPPTSTPGLESRIGQRWIAWVGAIVVFFSGVFFLKHAFDNDWIGPTGQVVICALVGLALLVTGTSFLRRHWPALGQILMGLGLAILYATFFAGSSSLYTPPVLSPHTAFGFMVLVTAVGMTLAILHDAVSLAFLAVLGGILTPVLCSTGEDARDILFAYLLLLDLGVLAVAFFRGWRLLDTLALLGTVILYGGWYSKFYHPAGLAPALAWLGVFYAVFLVLPFTYHLVRKQPVTLERFVMALANALFAAAFAWHMLHTDYLFAMGFVALAMAAAYLVLGALLRRALPSDTRALFGLIAMTVTFLTLAVPMELRAHGILLAWVAEAPVLAYLAYRFRYLPVRIFAAAILVLGVGRLFAVHWPLHDHAVVPFFNHYFLSALAVPAAAAVYALIHRRYQREATVWDQILQAAAALGAGFLALIILDAEIADYLNRTNCPIASVSLVTALWALGSLVYLWAGIKLTRTAPWTWGTGTLALVVAIVLGIAALNEPQGTTRQLFLNGPFAAGLLVVLATFAYARFAAPVADKNLPESRAPLVIYSTLGMVGLLLLLSAEVYNESTSVIADSTAAQRTGQMAITLVWSLYAAALLVLGFWRRWRAIRIAGLVLFGLAALKLVLIDLTELKDIYRIVSFLVLGLLMLAASYLYHRLEKRLSAAAPDPVGAATQPGEQP